MQIQGNILIAECSAYDFKERFERKKMKSWLKSVSAFANTEGGSLFYGVDNDGEIVGIDDAQSDVKYGCSLPCCLWLQRRIPYEAEE